MTSRESVMVALLASLEGCGAFKSVGRRNRSPDTFKPAETPALMLVEHSDLYRATSTHQPAVRRLSVLAIVYFDVGDDDNAIPSATINPILDTIDTLFGPDRPPRLGPETLGGLVSSVTIDGTLVRAPGDVTGKGLAVVPLSIVLP